MTSFKEALGLLGQAIDEFIANKYNTECVPVENVVITPPIVTEPPVVQPSNNTGLFVGEPTKTPYMKDIVKLGVTSNGGQYRVVEFNDGKMRVYQSVVGGYKQVSDTSKDTPKSGMYGYLPHGFMLENINKVLWNEIEAKLFPEEIK